VKTFLPPPLSALISTFQFVQQVHFTIETMFFPFFYCVVKAFADRFRSSQRVFWRVKTCNRSPMIPPTIPNYNFAFANLLLLFVQHFLCRPCPAPSKSHPGIPAAKRCKDRTLSHKCTTMSSPCHNHDRTLS